MSPFAFLSDVLMATVRLRLMGVNAREESDTVPTDPWGSEIVNLFNGDTFSPVSVNNLAGGLMYSGIASINPAQLGH